MRLNTVAATAAIPASGSVAASKYKFCARHNTEEVGGFIRLRRVMGGLTALGADTLAAAKLTITGEYAGL